ncbi:MAG: type II toxin-antitoxin system PemK/MazF family toxin, partial [Actinobacteria bacterium]|nr:type II toxin-antitoxin system PemK/MazF family toxin [Actinomycetota bacterium]
HRGEIYLVNLEPAKSGEANKQRPAVVVSNDGANSSAARSGHGVITVVPVTSNVARVYPFQVLLPANATGLDLDSKAQAEQVRSISVDRLGAAIGEVPHALMEELDEALRLHLAL